MRSVPATITRLLSISVVLVLATACGKTSPSPTSPSPTSPSPTSPNLTATWSGTQTKVGGSESNALQARWTATQNGTTVTGPFVITFHHPGDPNLQSATGTLTGTVTATQVSLTETFPAGAFAAIGSATCSFSGTGTATPTSTTVSATLTLRFTQPCADFLGAAETEAHLLSLTKQ